MSKQILLIEDDPDLAELISDYLTMNYYDVHHAGLGQEGLDLLDAKERDIDLVVLDLMLPDMLHSNHQPCWHQSYYLHQRHKWLWSYRHPLLQQLSAVKEE